MSISKELKELRDAIRRIDEKPHPQKDRMKAYIEDWCQELGWSDDPSIIGRAQDVESEIRGYLKKSLEKLFYIEQKKFRPKKKASGPEVLRAIENKMTSKTLILIALMFVGAGYASYTLQQMHKQKQISTQPPRPDRLPVQPILWKLVLVINAKHQDLLARMKNQELSFIDQDELYSATQYLWMGAQQQLTANTELSHWLHSGEYPDTSVSDFDVHLVEIELPRNITELQPKMSSLDRRDAFDQVVKDGKVIRVTPRLPSEAFANTGVYEL